MPKPSIIPISPAAPLEDWPPFTEAEIASGARAQKGLMLFEDKARGLSVGVWEMEANESHWMDYPFNEFMTVLDGEVVIEEEGRKVSVKAGESFILPKGLRCRWTQPGQVRKIFVIFDDPSGLKNAGPLQTLKIDPNARLAPSTPPSAEMLLSPVPVQHTKEFRGCHGSALHRRLGHDGLSPQAHRLSAPRAYASSRGQRHLHR
ncbi:MAG: DUF861 domain-containing protein [Hyphomicrobiales bacterium]|nr:MAG: DUF861 domain-containing protein [Hyphomicrobiales bacterium]